MEKKYYIYCWFNVKTLEIFYIGLGTGNRRYQTKRRNHLFKEYFKESKCEVLLLKTGLSEDEGVQVEKILIKAINPCCNMTKGGERTNGIKISESLKGRTFSNQHKENLRKAAILNWKNRSRLINNKAVVVLDKEGNTIKRFKAKYQMGIWLHEEFGYGKNARSAQRKADKYFKSKCLFEDKFYFVER